MSREGQFDPSLVASAWFGETIEQWFDESFATKPGRADLSVVGRLLSTDNNEGVSGTVGVTVAATFTDTETSDSISATASVDITSTGSVNEANDSVTTQSKVAVDSSANLSEAHDQITARGSLPVIGTGSHNEAPDQANGSATSNRVYVIDQSRAALLYNIALLHGLVQGSPLQVGTTNRTAGQIQQTIAGDENVIIATTMLSAFDGDLNAIIDDLSAIHGLTCELQVTPSQRIAGSIVQSFTDLDGVTTVNRTA